MQEENGVDYSGGSSMSVTMVQMVRASTVNDITLDEHAIHFML